MRNRMHSPSDWQMVMLGGIGMPGIVIAGLLAAGKPEAAGIIGILAGIFLTMVTLGTLTAHHATAVMKEATEEAAFPATTELAPEVIADIESIPGLDLVESVPVAPQSDVTVQVSKVDGPCAHGFLPGNTWGIDNKGNLSRPICAAAAKEFKALYQALPGSEMPKEIICRCPLADRKVAFKLMTED